MAVPKEHVQIRFPFPLTEDQCLGPSVCRRSWTLSCDSQTMYYEDNNIVLKVRSVHFIKICHYNASLDVNGRLTTLYRQTAWTERCD